MMTRTPGQLLGSGRTAEIFAFGSGRILKLFRDWCPASWAGYEYEIARKVEASGLPVPGVFDLVELAGRRGVVYERIEGPSMLEILTRKTWRLPALARSLAELHTAIHAVKAEDFPSYSADLGRRIREAARLPSALKEAALAALGGLPDGDALCHGDLHPGNIILSPRGPVIIDWITAARCDPRADLARSTVLLRYAGVPPGTGCIPLVNAARGCFYRVYLRRYMRLVPAAWTGIDSWLLPVAAARLREDIAYEREDLLALVERLAKLTP